MELWKGMEMSEEYCKKCKGSRSPLADDYFIRKCWCLEIEEIEKEEDE